MEEGGGLAPPGPVDSECYRSSHPGFASPLGPPPRISAAEAGTRRAQRSATLCFGLRPQPPCCRAATPDAPEGTPTASAVSVARGRQAPPPDSNCVSPSDFLTVFDGRVSVEHVARPYVTLVTRATPFRPATLHLPGATRPIVHRVTNLSVHQSPNYRRGR